MAPRRRCDAHHRGRRQARVLAAALPLEVKIESRWRWGGLHHRNRLGEVPAPGRSTRPARRISSRRSSSGRHAVEEGRAEEESLRTVGHRVGAAVDHQARALGDALLDVGEDAPAVASLMTGPMPTPACAPSPTFSAFAAAARRSRASAWTGRPAGGRCRRDHRSPAQPKKDSVMTSMARSRSASGITTTKFLAPPRACTRLPAWVPRR